MGNQKQNYTQDDLHGMRINNFLPFLVELLEMIYFLHIHKPTFILLFKLFLNICYELRNIGSVICRMILEYNHKLDILKILLKVGNSLSCINLIFS